MRIQSLFYSVALLFSRSSIQSPFYSVALLFSRSSYRNRLALPRQSPGRARAPPHVHVESPSLLAPAQLHQPARPTRP